MLFLKQMEDETTLLLQSFYGSLGFVWDYLGEPAPER